MEAKLKAKELIEKYISLDLEIGGEFDGYLTMKKHDAKTCAMIMVDGILNILFQHHEIDYWKEVKSELEAL